MTILTPAARRKTILYLTEDVSSSAELADRLDCTVSEAEVIEINMVTDNLLARSPGFYQNPRFFLTDNGLAYMALVGAKEPLDPQDVLTAIKSKPSGGFYAGTRLQVYHALMTMVQQGLAVTEDGGGTFALAGEDAEG